MLSSTKKVENFGRNSKEWPVNLINLIPRMSNLFSQPTLTITVELFNSLFLQKLNTKFIHKLPKFAIHRSCWNVLISIWFLVNEFV